MEPALGMTSDNRKYKATHILEFFVLAFLHARLAATFYSRYEMQISRNVPKHLFLENSFSLLTTKYYPRKVNPSEALRLSCMKILCFHLLFLPQKGDNPSLANVPITQIFAHSAIMYSVYKTQSCTSERGVNQTREPPARFLFLGISALN